jgi:hypothetical protein
MGASGRESAQGDAPDREDAARRGHDLRIVEYFFPRHRPPAALAAALPCVPIRLHDAGRTVRRGRMP